MMKTYIRKYDGAVVKAEEGYTIRLGHCYRVEGLGTFESSHFHDLFERPDLQSQIDAQNFLLQNIVDEINMAETDEELLKSGRIPLDAIKLLAERLDRLEAKSRENQLN